MACIDHLMEDGKSETLKGLEEDDLVEFIGRAESNSFARYRHQNCESRCHCHSKVHESDITWPSEKPRITDQRYST